MIHLINHHLALNLLMLPWDLLRSLSDRTSGLPWPSWPGWMLWAPPLETPRPGTQKLHPIPMKESKASCKKVCKVNHRVSLPEQETRIRGCAGLAGLGRVREAQS